MLEQLIKNKVRQSLLEHSMLVENYATNQELIKLGKKFMFKMLKIWVRNQEVDIAHKIYSRDFIDPDDYEVLNQFLKESQISLEFSNTLEARGQLSRGADPSRKRYSITIRILDYHMEEIGKHLAGPKKDDLHMLSHWTTERYESTMLHELQHAYDAWRSGGKFANTQYSPTHQKKEMKAKFAGFKDSEERDEKDMKNILTFQNSYLKLPHEINARFAQTIKELRVWDLIEVNGSYSREIVDWEIYLDEFKRNFLGWEGMKVRVKKNLIRRLSKVYTDASEEFKNREK